MIIALKINKFRCELHVYQFFILNIKHRIYKCLERSIYLHTSATNSDYPPKKRISSSEIRSILEKLPWDRGFTGNGLFMVLVLDGNPEIGAHVRSILCYLICLSNLISSRVVTIRILYLTYTPSCVCKMSWFTI